MPAWFVLDFKYQQLLSITHFGGWYREPIGWVITADPQLHPTGSWIMPTDPGDTRCE